jgi:iron complex transport system permease protein
MTRLRRSAPVVGAALALCVAVVCALLWGAEPVSPLAVLDPNSLDRVLVVNARLPRVLLAALAGLGLAASGCAFQAVLRNPLAEPYVLGVSGGAAFGATLALTLGVAQTTILAASAVPLAAFGGGVLATLAVLGLSRKLPHEGGATLLLSGIVINAIAAAAITMEKTLLSPEKSHELLFWLTGYLDVPPVNSLAVVGACVALGVAFLVAKAPALNVMCLGDEDAMHLGVDVSKLARQVMLACSLIVGAIVSLTGLVGFVGLLVPHAVRRRTGSDMRRLVPLASLYGATTLVLCDLGGRLAFRWLRTEPPVGAVTALVGGPLFLMLLRRQNSPTAN